MNNHFVDDVVHAFFDGARVIRILLARNREVSPPC